MQNPFETQPYPSHNPNGMHLAMLVPNQDYRSQRPNLGLVERLLNRCCTVVAPGLHVGNPSAINADNLRCHGVETDDACGAGNAKVTLPALPGGRRNG
jgi:hypothetical protein